MHRRAETLKWLQTQLRSPGLSFLDRAALFEQAAAQGVSNPDIAAVADLTPQAVEQSLILAGAPSELKTFVRTGKIAPANAIKIVRYCRKVDGHDPVAIAQEAIFAARAEGKDKASAKHLPAYIRSSGSASRLEIEAELKANLRPLVDSIADLLKTTSDGKIKLALSRSQAGHLMELLSDE